MISLNMHTDRYYTECMTGWRAENLNEILSKDNKPIVSMDTKKCDNATLFTSESHLGLKCHHYSDNFVLGREDRSLGY